MNSPTDSVLAIVAALLVLLTALLDPRFSSALAIGLLVVYAIYKMIQHDQRRSHP
ncbi:MAG: hypothetical protein U0528_17730 [Anaerolineae bacterium]|nr:hypothetical protein [Anaerolineae bacterium]